MHVQCLRPNCHGVWAKCELTQTTLMSTLQVFAHCLLQSLLASWRSISLLPNVGGTTGLVRCSDLGPEALRVSMTMSLTCMIPLTLLCIAIRSNGSEKRAHPAKLEPRHTRSNTSARHKSSKSCQGLCNVTGMCSMAMLLLPAAIMQGERQ